MNPVFDTFGEKVAALTPLVRPSLLERSQFKLMRIRTPSVSRAPIPSTFGKIAVGIDDISTVVHEDPLPSTHKRLARKKTAMIHPSMQVPSETMTKEKWKQTFKDVPISILAGGLGYGIGRTLAEVIGEKTVNKIMTESGGMPNAAVRPKWVKAMPLVMAALTAGGAYAGSRLRETLKKRREEREEREG
jgi:hypothetical protein